MSLIEVFVQTLAVTVERYIAVCRPHQHLGLVTVIHHHHHHHHHHHLQSEGQHFVSIQLNEP